MICVGRVCYVWEGRLCEVCDVWWEGVDTNLTDVWKELSEEVVFKVEVPATHCQTLLGLRSSTDTAHSRRGLKLHITERHISSQWLAFVHHTHNIILFTVADIRTCITQHHTHYITLFTVAGIRVSHYHTHYTCTYCTQRECFYHCNELVEKKRVAA